MKMRSIPPGYLLSAILLIWICGMAARYEYAAWKLRIEQTKIDTRDVPGWHVLVTSRTPTIGGGKETSVSIIEFFDYQCPYCKVMEPRLDKLVADHPGEVAIYRYNFPLVSLHPYAMAAALAANCAGMQGKYGAYDKALFAQAHLSDVDWTTLAQKVGVADVDSFTRCVNDKESAPMVTHDISVGHSIEITSTPTFILNGKLVSGSLTDEQLTRLYSELRHGK